MFGFARNARLEIFFACLYLVLFVVAEALLVKQLGAAVDALKFLSQSVAARPESRAVLSGYEALVLAPSPAVQLVYFSVLFLVLLSVLLLLARFWREIANMRFSMNMVFFIREAVYDKIQRVGFGFHDSISSGQLINRALSDLQHVRAFIQTSILTTLEILLAVGMYIGVLLVISPTLALLSLVPLPIWCYYILRFSKRVQPAVKSALETEDRNVQLITENIAGVHVVKAFASEPQEVAKYNENADEFLRRVLTRIRLFANFQPIVRGIATASNLTLYLVVGYEIVYHGLNPGALVVVAGAMGAILGRLQQIQTINEQYQSAIVSSQRLYEVLNAPPTVWEKPEATGLPPGAGEVRFEGVTFGYDVAKPVLKGLTFTVKAGSQVAVVGPTGAGKTTLINLLARFYDPQEGRILIDGVDLRDLKLASLRREVGFVFQETYLFSDTVRANIAYGRPGVTVGEIEAAARLAQAHEFIEQLPQGYETILGERGTSLSGGQKQRLAIARAILFNPRVLVLDDATAAVDPETEDLIRRGTRAVMADHTVFVIAHRISTVKQADLVLVLEHGQITQMGTHEQLMEQDGHYRDIAAVQLYGDDMSLTDEEGESPSHLKRMLDVRKTAAVANLAAGKMPQKEDQP
jgi:ABC-type multidrug transport system fused ATPase/permease subunit